MKESFKFSEILKNSIDLNSSNFWTFQARLLLTHAFRRQHDQLRLVINRVLRPAALASQEAHAPNNAEIIGEPLPLAARDKAAAGLDVADANAIEVSWLFFGVWSDFFFIFSFLNYWLFSIKKKIQKYFHFRFFFILSLFQNF